MNNTSYRGEKYMKSKAIIRDNITLNVNPEGLKTQLKEQINEMNDLETLGDKPLNVLVVGGSSGYGLATRVVLQEKANANILSVSFEREPKGKRLGSPGYYQNIFFKEMYPTTHDINGDAFSDEIKNKVVDHYKNLNQKIDLVVYSIASGIRIDPKTQEKYISSLKPIGQPYSGLNVDIAKEVLVAQTLQPATQDEIDHTVKVMGGEDYFLWAQSLFEQDLLNKDVKFVTYTYVGPKLTHPIYKNGTIGYAKRDLEATTEKINELIKPLNGKAFISCSKAVVTKASIFIPTMALYASALFKVMKETKTHETITQHKYRLFKDYIFNGFEKTMIPLDRFEMEPTVQKNVENILTTISDENFKEKVDFEVFKKEYVALNGF